MDGCYAESYVHRKPTSGSMIGKCVLITVVIMLISFTIMTFLMGAFMVAILGFALSCFSIFMVVIYFPRFNVDWEYVFVDGQLDFDQILGGNARKRKLRIDFEQTEIVAKSGSHHLDSYSRMTMKEYNYSSLDETAETYTIIAHKGNELLKVIFEPDQNMIETMRSKSSRKVKKD